MNTVRGPPTFSTGRAVPRFVNMDGDQLGNTDLIVDADGDPYPATSSQTLGTTTHPIANIYLSGLPRAFYEEGQFIPGMTAATPANLSIVFAGRSGYYQRLGNLVFVNFGMAISSIALNGASGDALFTDLPFTSSQTCLLQINMQEVNTVTGNVMNLTAQVNAGETRAVIRQTVDGGLASVNLPIGDVDPTNLFTVTGCYATS